MSASGSPPAHRRPGERSVPRIDAQAGVPWTGWPRAQLAFKDSMVRGILQFTPRTAFRCVLHRCESQDIRRRESCRAGLQSEKPPSAFPTPKRDGPKATETHTRPTVPWRPPRPVWSPRHPGSLHHAPPRQETRAKNQMGAVADEGQGRRSRSALAFPTPMLNRHAFAGLSVNPVSTMILPQVHLRKPCYDFSFL